MRAFAVGLVLAGVLSSCVRDGGATVSADGPLPPGPAAASPEGTVLVPAGEFRMGCAPDHDGDCEADGQPAHTVTLRPFAIDRTEVTVADYAICVAAGACAAPVAGKGGTWGVAGREWHPVNNVSWNDASAYCAWKGRRLCTEAEWEKAARGSDGRPYPWGGAAPSCARVVMREGDEAGCGAAAPAPVGSRPEGASPYGALDLAGNVWEWVADWYKGTYYRVSPTSDPVGPPRGATRVVRGGGYDNGAPELRAFVRHNASPSFTYSLIGFRCCVSVD